VGGGYGRGEEHTPASSMACDVRWPTSMSGMKAYEFALKKPPTANWRTNKERHMEECVGNKHVSSGVRMGDKHVSSGVRMGDKHVSSGVRMGDMNERVVRRDAAHSVHSVAGSLETLSRHRNATDNTSVHGNVSGNSRFMSMQMRSKQRDGQDVSQMRDWRRGRDATADEQKRISNSHNVPHSPQAARSRR
jgi:hypothetical protein